VSEPITLGTAPSENVPAPQPTPAGDSGHIDPEQYYALQEQVARYESALHRLDPHADRIKRLMDDPDAAKLFDDSLAAYEQMRARQGPQIDEAQRPIYEKVSKLEQFVDRFEQQQRAEAEKPQREFQSRWDHWQNDPVNNRFFQRLTADHKLEQKDLQWLAQEAVAHDFAPLEEVWKENSWRFVKAESSPPPPSLRSDSGEIGVPAATKVTPDAVSMRQRIVELERHRRGA